MTNNEDRGEERSLTAAAVVRLAASVDQDVLNDVLAARHWVENVEVAMQWHTARMEALWQEMRASTHGIEQDRVFELLGCMSSTGERFGLALAAGNEVAIWRGARSRHRGVDLRRRSRRGHLHRLRPHQRPDHARLVVRRVKDARYPDALFPVRRYHPFFTNTDCPPRRPTSSTAATRSSRRCSPT
jgi:hypothetical protein